MLTLTDPEDNTTTWVYDPLNRVSTETNELNKVRSFQYDLVDNLIQATDRNNRVRTFSYDALYRRTGEVSVDPVLNPYPSFTYVYNDAGELTSTSDSYSSYAMAYDRLAR